MNKLDDTLTLPTVFLIVVLAVVTMLIRRLVEAIWPTLSATTPLSRAQKIWEQLCLPVIPALLGLLFCSLVPPSFYPYPAVATATRLSLSFYGFTLGWFSSGGYRYITSVLKQRWNIDAPQ